MLDRQRTILDAAGDLEVWCRQAALPFWLNRGLDSNGSFYEQLSESGVPDTGVNRRVRVHFRQLYVFSHAEVAGWAPDGTRAACDRAMRHAADCILSDGSPGAPFLLMPDGRQIADSRRDLYTQAFILLAMAWRYRASGDPAALAVAGDMADFLESAMRHPEGGWREEWPETAGSHVRRQNPHMHLFEAFLALYEATKQDRWLELATEVYGLFRTRFLDRETGCLIEYFVDDLSPHPDLSHTIEPGHMMEWVWLLDIFMRASGRDCRTDMTTLYRKAEAIGRDPATGFLFDETSPDGEVLQATRRSWPQTEYIKASVALHRRGIADTAPMAARLIDRLLSTYLDVPTRGGWRDKYDTQGMPVGGAMSASTFYHLFACAIEASDVARRGG